MESIYSGYNYEELQKALEELNDELEETEELRMMQLGQTGRHVPAGLVNKYEIMMEDINERIAMVKSCMEKYK